MIDFEIPGDVKELRARVARFIDDHVLPAEAEVGTRPYFDIVEELQGKARAEGLWCPFVPVEWGGMGLGHLANAIVQIEVGRSFSMLAAWALELHGPAGRDDVHAHRARHRGAEGALPPAARRR